MRKSVATLVLLAASVSAPPSIAAEWGSTALAQAVAAAAGQPVMQVRGGMAGGGGMGMGAEGGMGMGGGGMGMGGAGSMGNAEADSDLPAREAGGGGPRSGDHAACMASYRSDTSWLTRWARCAVGLKGTVHPRPAVAKRHGKKPPPHRVASRNAAGATH
ncbi:hypothetical protein [Rhodopila globiformis]|uniref:Uncharacterized protein n=1 Tax=Rhodopila globiformis TaxID=1071 RepID=A0A2S6N0Q9_RHOGL|nr:hypothetical protein [Rhodopila globiformis]PPQ28204.1 hypothetical protein CCS01_24960 [Rhodopila globiformis]